MNSTDSSNPSEAGSQTADSSNVPGGPPPEASVSAPASASTTAPEATTAATSSGDASSDEASGEGAAAGAAGGEPGAASPEKKKRKRRRRKKGAGAQGALAAEGDAGTSSEEGGEEEGEAKEAKGDKPADAKASGDKKKKRSRRERGDRPGKDARERPAFNVGDVVFGKILEIGDDAIFVDLSGKGRAIFDKLELLLPEDVADRIEEDTRRAEARAEAIIADRDPDAAEAEASAAHAAEKEKAAEAEAAAKAAPAAEPVPIPAPEENPAPTAEVAGESTDEGAVPAPEAAPQRRIVQPRAREEAAPEGASVEGAAAEVASAEVAVPTVDASVAPPVAEASSEGDASAQPEEPSAEASASEGAGADGVVQLPRVVLEAGAPFVGVVHNDGGRGGLVVLTHHPKRASKAKPAVAAAFKQKTELFGLVTGVIKGGVEIDVDGVRAFAPGSHMDLRLGADLSALVGKRLAFAVTQYGKRGRDVVLSRRAMLEAEAKVAREEALSKITVGATVTGVVRSVVQFGAFIDIGGIEGLVPLTEMSHNRSDTPSDVFKAGAEIEVKILRVDDRGKVWLSRKATIPDPWQAVAEKYAVSSRHTGKVVRLQPFGAFVELEPGIDGLIHTGDLSIKRIEHPSDVVKVGDAIEVVVATLDPGSHKIGLHPAPTGAAADEAPQRVQLHKVVKVQVVSIETGGLTVRVLGATGRHARGFIPAGGTGTPRGTDLRKQFPPGHTFDAKVIEMDPKRSEVKLSIKAMNEENERSAYQQYRQQVKREAKFGTFADLLAKRGPTQK